VDTAKNLSRRSLARSVGAGGPVCLQCGRYPGALVSEEIHVGAECGIAVINQAIAPLLGIVKNPPGHPLIVAEGVQRLSNRFGIHFAHQLSNQLFLAPQRAVRFDGLRTDHGIAQVLVKFNAAKLLT